MAITLVQHTSASDTGSPVTHLSLAFSSNNAAGNLLVMCFRAPFGSTNTYSVADTQGNTWVEFPSGAANGNEFNSMWYAQNCKVGANTVTVTDVGGGTSFFRLIIAEFSGLSLTAAFVASSKVTAQHWATPNIVTTQANELLISIGLTSNLGSTLSAPFTQRRTFSSGGSDYGAFGEQVVSSIGSYAGYGNGSTSPYLSVIAAFKGSGTPAYVQSTSTAYGATASLAFGSNNTAGGLILVLLSNAASGSTVSDSQGNTYTQLFTNTTYNSQRQTAWYAPNCKAGANTVTIGTPGSSQSIIIAEYSGVAASSPLDQTTLSVGSPSHITSEGITTSDPTILVLGFGSNATADSQSPAADSGWTTVDSVAGNLFLVYKTAGAGSYGFGGTYSSAVQWYAAIAAFTATIAPKSYASAYILG